MELISLFITNKLLEMSIVDQKYWKGEIDIKTWHKEFDRIHDETLDTLDPQFMKDQMLNIQEVL